MRLDRLLDAVDVVGTRGDPGRTEITGVVHDSRQVRPGVLFCCVPGKHTDGHEHAGDAVARGAVALLCQREAALEASQVVVRDVRAAMGPVAAAFHGHPSRTLTVLGVTGTNGKTTTTHLLEAALEAGGVPTGVIGTLSGSRTTPEATELQARLAAFRAAGKKAVAMEVSSHALAQARVEATCFRVAVFTNLSRDHLDFHGSLEEYFQAKARLFEPSRAQAAVVNADDPYGRRLLETARLPTVAFTLAEAEDLEVGVIESRFRWRGHPVKLALGGRVNVANALAAAVTAAEIGVDPAAVTEGVSAAEPLPGRFEAVNAGQPFSVIVDYAHTPAALEALLLAARPAGGRLLVVFGCGGERDPGKRPAMGAVAARLADWAVVTSDNPRGEDPDAIIEQVLQGAGGARRLQVEPDRRAAIALALAEARPGDLVVVAGKGHETLQELGEGAVPFDDRQVVREELAR